MAGTPDNQGTSTRPYLLRALHDWCTDNGYTPYIAVYVDGSVQVPMEYVKNNEIVLNVGFDATSAATNPSAPPRVHADCGWRVPSPIRRTSRPPRRPMTTRPTPARPAAAARRSSA